MPQELGDALVDLRRNEQVSRLRLSGLSADDVEEFVPPGRRAARREPAGAGRGDLRADRRQRVPASPSCGASCVEAGAADGPAADLAGSLAGARHARGRARRGEPAARAARARRRGRARAGLGRRPRVRDRRDPRGRRLDAAALAAALDEAVASGMIEEVPGHTLAHRFAHELVRRALYDRLPRGVAPSSTCGSPRRSTSASPTARPARSATSPTTSPPPRRSAATDRAVEYSLLAAAAAMVGAGVRRGRRGAADGARARHPGRHRPGGRPARPRRGDATGPAGRSTRRRRSCAAADIARSLGDGRRLARAAVGYEDACWRMGIADEGALELLEEAAEALDRGRLRAARRACSAALGRALAFAGEAERERGRARRGDRHGPPDRRAAGARAGAEPLVLAARADAASRDMLDMLARGA